MKRKYVRKQKDEEKEVVKGTVDACEHKEVSMGISPADGRIVKQCRTCRKEMK